MEKYITVAEFARLVGVTPQAIYPRLEKDLKTYFKVIKGKKSLDIDALSVFDVELEQEFKQEFEQIQKLEDELNNVKEQNSTLKDDLNYFKELLNNNNETLNVLKEQLIEKDKQIEQLNTHLSFSNNLVDQSQRLNAAEKIAQLPAAQQPEQKPAETAKKWFQFWK